MARLPRPEVWISSALVYVAVIFVAGGRCAAYYGSPAYSAPNYYETPAYEQPAYYEAAPSYYDKPSYDAPAYYDKPSYDTPAYYGSPSNQWPSAYESAYEAPAYYDKPSYDAPAYYDKPSYDAPAYYEKPSYDAPAYYEKPYDAPADYERSYEAPAYYEKPYDAPAYYEKPYEAPAYYEKPYEAPAYYEKPYEAPANYDKRGHYEKPYEAPAYYEKPHEAPAYYEKPYEAAAYYEKPASYDKPYYEPPAYSEKPYDKPAYYEKPAYEKPSHAKSYNSGIQFRVANSTRQCGILPAVHRNEYGYDRARMAFGEFPWLVAVLDTYQVYLAAGTIISPRHVLTSAKALYRTKENNVVVRIGEYDLQSDHNSLEAYKNHEIAVTKIYRYQSDRKRAYGGNNYPEDSQEQYNYDVAILELYEDIDFDAHPQVEPLCLPAYYEKPYAQNAYGYSGHAQNYAGVRDSYSQCWTAGWKHSPEEKISYQQEKEASKEVGNYGRSYKPKTCYDHYESSRTPRKALVSKVEDYEYNKPAYGHRQGYGYELPYKTESWEGDYAYDACYADEGSPIFCLVSTPYYEHESYAAYEPSYEPLYQPAHLTEYKPQYQADEYQPEYKPAYEPEYKPSYEPEYKPEYKPAYQPEYKPEYKPAYQPEYKPEYKPAYKPEYKPEYKPAYQPEYKPEYKPAYKPEYKPDYKASYQPEYKPGYQPDRKPRYQSGYKSSCLPDYKPCQEEYKPVSYKPSYKPEYKKPAYSSQYKRAADYYSYQTPSHYPKPDYDYKISAIPAEYDVDDYSRAVIVGVVSYGTQCSYGSYGQHKKITVTPLREIIDWILYVVRTSGYY